MKHRTENLFQISSMSVKAKRGDAFKEQTNSIIIAYKEINI